MDWHNNFFITFMHFFVWKIELFLVTFVKKKSCINLLFHFGIHSNTMYVIVLVSIFILFSIISNVEFSYHYLRPVRSLKFCVKRRQDFANIFTLPHLNAKFWICGILQFLFNFHSYLMKKKRNWGSLQIARRISRK